MVLMDLLIEQQWRSCSSFLWGCCGHPSLTARRSSPRPPLLCWVLSCFSCVQLCVTPWTAARKTPLSMGFPRHELEWIAISFCRESS